MIVALIVSGILLPLIWFGVAARRVVIRVVRDENHGLALFRTGRLICDFMEDHGNAWPRSWNDLDQERAARHPEEMRSQEFDEATVTVNWTVKPAEWVGMTGRSNNAVVPVMIWLTNRPANSDIPESLDGNRLTWDWMNDPRRTPKTEQ